MTQTKEHLFNVRKQGMGEFKKRDQRQTLISESDAGSFVMYNTVQVKSQPYTLQ